MAGDTMTSVRRGAGAIARRLGLRRPRSPSKVSATASPAGAGARPDSPGLTIAWTHPKEGGAPAVRLGVFRDLLALFPAGRLLDLGCGTGMFSVAAHEMAWRVTAVDARSERMLMTPGIDWVQHDVRSYDVSGFDVIALIGLLYHLELPDQLNLLRRCSQAVTILDTHHSNRPNTDESGYSGHTFHELPDDEADSLAATPTAAWGNLTSFWATQPDLVRMLLDCGFARVLALVPPNLPDRTFYLCLPQRQDRSRAQPPAG
jgi:SAM-dependent methyltransferase